jgi:molybdopterin-guanine dinucleotide biosynthesis protein B
MRVLGIAGPSGAGKTTLIERLIPLLRRRGLKVSTIKHAHHGFDLDRPGKDSHRHRAAGAEEVLIAAGDRWALLHEGAEPSLPALLARLSPVDLVLVEGYRGAALPRLEVHRPALGQPPLWPADRLVRAVASDAPLPACPLPVLPLDAPAVIGAWIAETTPVWRHASANA